MIKSICCIHGHSCVSFCQHIFCVVHFCHPQLLLLKYHHHYLMPNPHSFFTYKNSFGICIFHVFNSEDKINAPACLNLRRENVTVGEKEQRMMMTGMHIVVDIFCVTCGSIVGWKYVRSPTQLILKYYNMDFFFLVFLLTKFSLPTNYRVIFFVINLL